MINMLKTMYSIDTRALEVILSLQALFLGIWLLLPTDTFGSSGAYSVISTVFTEMGWGLYFVSIGLLQVMCIHSKSPTPRGIASTVSLFSWLFFDISLWLSGSFSAASVVYFTFVIEAAWCVIVLFKPIGSESRGNKR